MESKFPVSVIVPVRNEQSNVRQLVESLLSQTLRPQEIVIADGGSTDRTKQLIHEFIDRGDPVRLVEDSDAYPGRARNLAIQATETDWVAMTDAGTTVPLNWLANLVQEAGIGDSVDVVLGSYDPILSSFFKECLALTFVAIPLRVGDKYVRGPSTASMMIKKKVWEDLGKFPENLRACEDLLFFDRLLESRFVINYAPDAVIRWNIPDNFAETFRRFRKYSFHTLKAGLGRRWHLAVGRMYLAGLVVVGLTVFHHWWWGLLLLLVLGLRVHRTMRARRQSLELMHRIGPHTYFVVGIIMLWIDLAALAGVIDYIVGPKR